MFCFSTNCLRGDWILSSHLRTGSRGSLRTGWKLPWNQVLNTIWLTSLMYSVLLYRVVQKCWCHTCFSTICHSCRNEMIIYETSRCHVNQKRGEILHLLCFGKDCSLAFNVLHEHEWLNFGKKWRYKTVKKSKQFKGQNYSQSYNAFPVLNDQF